VSVEGVIGHARKAKSAPCGSNRESIERVFPALVRVTLPVPMLGTLANGDGDVLGVAVEAKGAAVGSEEPLKLIEIQLAVHRSGPYAKQGS
jgi:hypothetical protein